MRFAAIDIGSNAVRLLFSNVYENDAPSNFKKTSLVRVPLRLGVDSFIRHRISEENEEALIKTMLAFKHLIDVMKPVDFMACATSAMREAENGSEVVKKIRQQTGIEIDIIDGEREAELLYSNHVAEVLDSKSSYLYIDVGGGSTELTLISNKKRVASGSFNIGTVRILQNIAPDAEWQRLKSWLKHTVDEYWPVVGIGSGGNINTVFKLSGKKQGKALSYKQIKDISDHLKSFSFEERVRNLGLKSDRADVIIPALEIFISVMKWGKISKLHVPIIGLLDGMIHVLYEKYKKQHPDCN